ncbi:MAG: hypothetical protein LBS94_01455, partial [Prevotellaceae bacterium]|nr:hypothetical protein [Prevotellaceae bacterium]
MRYKPFILLCTALLLMLTRAVALPTFSGGTGSESDPFLISNRTDLAQLSQCLGAAGKGLHFQLTADIDLGAALWTPIGGRDNSWEADSCFMGKLHGEGHAIKNMHIDGRSNSYTALGLFASLREGAYLHNLHVVDAYVEAADNDTLSYVGLLVGDMQALCEGTQTDSITIRKCSATGVINTPVKVSSSSILTGGLLGEVYANATSSARATITVAQCSYSGTVIGSANLGGLIGAAECETSNTAINISECYAVAELRYVGNGGTTPVGGLVGIASTVSAIAIDRCYAAGSIAPHVSNPAASIGGLVGIVGKPNMSAYDGPVSIAQSVAAQTSIRVGGDDVARISQQLGSSANRVLVNNFGYADMKLDEALADSSAIGLHLPQGESKTLAELSAQATYSSAPLSWDFATLWAIRDDKSFPYFAQQSAPAFINDVLYRELTVNIARTADSVVARKGLARQRVGALPNAPAGNIAVELTGVNSGDTIFVTVYESGKLPSYCTWGVAHEAKGAGTAENPYQIWTRSDLENLRQPSHIGRLDSAIHYRIMADIDLGSDDWIPIGTSDNSGTDLTLAFRGKLHGGGHRLNNIRISTSTLAYVGLFGALANDAYVDSLYLVGGSIKCSTPGVGKTVCVGALAGYVCGSSAENAEAITIRGCSNSATVARTNDKYGYTGGLVGFTNGDVNVAVVSCSNFGNVTGCGDYTGGLIGHAQIFDPATLQLTNSYNHATVRSTQPEGLCELGGIVGRANANTSIISILDCYAVGSVLADTSTSVSFVGGLVGHTAGAVHISNSLAAQDWIGSASAMPAGKFQRLVGDAAVDTTTIIVNGLALDSLKINGSATSGTADNFQGLNKSLPDLKKQETYSWDFADTWAIRDRKTLPYLGWQSATPVIDRLFLNSKTSYVGEVNILNRADSIGVYKGSAMVRVTAIRPAPAGNRGFTLTAASSIGIGDTLFFVSFEALKSPSIVVQAVIKAPPAPLKGDYTIGFATTDTTNFASFADAQEAITYGGLAGDVTFRIAAGEYQQVADPFLEFPANVAAHPYHLLIEGAGSVTLRYAEGADVDARHIAIADTLHTTIRNLRLQGPNSATTQPYASWRVGGGVEYSVPDALDTLRLHNLNIDGCRADSIGGAVAMSAKAGSLLLMDGCNIAHCYADVNGGAIYAAPQASVYLSAIADCGAGRGKGGGVY